jgi:hypothetical protein
VRRDWIMEYDRLGAKGYAVLYTDVRRNLYRRPIKCWHVAKKDGTPNWFAIENQYELMIECGFVQVEPLT